MKNFIKYSFYVTAFTLAIFSAYATPVTHAQTTTACPAGYTCTPIAAQPVGCPVGYTCTPVAPTSSSGYNGSGVGYAGVSDGGYYDSNGCFDYTFSNNLSLGSTGSDVSALQTFLISKGFSIRNISAGWTPKGYFGSQTSAALIQYQQSVGLTATGQLDAITISNINKSMNCVSSPAQPTNPTQPTGSKGAIWATIMSASSVTTGSPFSISGNTSITSGSLTVVIAGPNYTGATDWNTVGNLLKSSTMLVGGYAQIQGLANAQSYQYWSAQFGGIQTPGSYTVLVYDSSGDLLTTGTITIGPSTQPTNSNGSITVTNPQVGGVFDNSGGKPNIATITWTSTGLGNNPVGINLLSSSGSLVKNIVASISNTGSYVWAYDPTIPNGTYVVQIYVAGKGVAVGTSGYFQIVNSQNSSQPTSMQTYQNTSPDGSISFSFQYPVNLSINNDISLSVMAYTNRAGSSVDSNGCYVSALEGSKDLGTSVSVDGWTFCKSQGGDAGTGHAYTHYYYTTQADGWYVTLDYQTNSLGGTSSQDIAAMMNYIQQSLQTFQMGAKG